MTKLEVRTGSGSYGISIGRNLNMGKLLKEIKPESRICIISDTNVFPLYGEAVRGDLTAEGYDVIAYVMEAGEAGKNFRQAETILEFLAEAEITREDTLMALGGGVVGDITGFCSSIYNRGMDFVQIPTTLLAAVDSSVGGKTAVDLSLGKNLAGAFHQPIGVFLDIHFMDSLTDGILAQGMAEVIKYGLIMDNTFLGQLENNELPLEEICRRCIENKAFVVGRDEQDRGVRHILNFGHTPAHAIETLSNYTISHGEAVAMGMVIMTAMSESLGMLEKGSMASTAALIRQYGLPMPGEYEPKKLAEISARDKKRRGNTIDIVLLEALGKCRIINVPVDILGRFYAQALDYIKDNYNHEY